MRISAAVLGAPDANALAAFYARLLDWTIVEDHPGWVRVRHPAGELTPAGLSFAHQEQYVEPVWPATADAQQMMVHLDIACDDLTSGVEWAIECGARLADHQPQPHVRVMLDPFGHPFCLFQGPV